MEYIIRPLLFTKLLLLRTTKHATNITQKLRFLTRIHFAAFLSFRRRLGTMWTPFVSFLRSLGHIRCWLNLPPFVAAAVAAAVAVFGRLFSVDSGEKSIQL